METPSRFKISWRQSSRISGNLPFAKRKMSSSSIETRHAEPDLSEYFYYGQWRGSPETISGRGSSISYTEPLRKSLEALLRDLDVVTLLDAPCGDFNWMKVVDLGDIQYIGMDIVEKIIEENKSKYGSPKRLFVCGDITKDSLPPANLVMVRDCLFHLPFRSIANFFENYLRSDIPHILVTCNTNETNTDLAVPGTYRPVNLLKPPFSLPPPPAGRRLRDYPDGAPERHMMLWNQEDVRAAITSNILSTLRPSSPEGHQITDPSATQDPVNFLSGEDLDCFNRAQNSNRFFQHYSRQFPHRDELMNVARTSFEKLGFFTKHPSRAFEYPWMLSNVPHMDGVVVDLGAGLSPLPFMFAERGSKVLTVDYSANVRTPQNREDWNEWGFLDYAQIDGRIRSENIDFGKLAVKPGTVDVVYSVSVIEHMPASVRQAVVKKIGEILKPGGLLVLTLDLVPGTKRLWNRDRGKQVEDIDLHGKLRNFLGELREVGIRRQSLEIKRGLPGSITDIACLVAAKRRNNLMRKPRNEGSSPHA